MSNTRVAIIDMDGILADCTRRHKRATIFVDGLLTEVRRHNFDEETYKKAWNDLFYSKLAFYSQDWMYSDKPVIGARQAVKDLIAEGWEVLILTSRPVEYRQVTEQWLVNYGFKELLETRPDVILKPKDKQFTKTAVWKAQEVARIISRYEVKELLFIDDDQLTRAAVLTIQREDLTKTVKDRLVEGGGHVPTDNDASASTYGQSVSKEDQDSAE